MRPQDVPGKAGIIRSDADVATGLAALLRADPRLGAIAAVAGPLPLRRNPGGLPGLARIIVAQQVSRASAEAIFARLESEFDIADPQAFLTADDAAYRHAGLSRPKQRTMRAVAEAVHGGALDFARLDAAPAAAAIAELVAVSGIGPWTAECYLLFCAGHPDIFPAGDLALQKAVEHAFDLPGRPLPKDLIPLAAQWSPHRGAAALMFWRYFSAMKNSDAWDAL